MNETIAQFAKTILASSQNFNPAEEDGVCSPFLANITGISNLTYFCRHVISR